MLLLIWYKLNVKYRFQPMKLDLAYSHEVYDAIQTLWRRHRLWQGSSYANNHKLPQLCTDFNNFKNKCCVREGYCKESILWQKDNTTASMSSDQRFYIVNPFVREMFYWGVVWYACCTKTLEIVASSPLNLLFHKLISCYTYGVIGFLQRYMRVSPICILKLGCISKHYPLTS